MKFNWGTGIALFYSFFVLALVYQVFKSTQYDHSLVSDQYYADDLKYQEHYDKLRNSQLLETDLRVTHLPQRNVVMLEFPNDLGAPGGEIHFFCPSDSKQDFRVPVQPADGLRQEVPIRGLKPGLWRVKVDWSAGERGFYQEKDIQI